MPARNKEYHPTESIRKMQQKIGIRNKQRRTAKNGRYSEDNRKEEMYENELLEKYQFSLIDQSDFVN